jgi:ribosomal protein S27AE
METSENILIAVRQFLSSQAERPKQQQCPTCNSFMQHLDGLFWIIDKNESKWQISLPFCPTCAPGSYALLSSTPTIQ